MAVSNVFSSSMSASQLMQTAKVAHEALVEQAPLLDDQSAQAVQAVMQLTSSISNSAGSTQASQTISRLHEEVNTISQRSSGNSGVSQAMTLLKSMGIKQMDVLNRVLKGMLSGAESEIAGALEAELKEIIDQMLDDGIDSIDELYQIMSILGFISHSLDPEMLKDLVSKINEELGVFVSLQMSTISDPNEKRGFINMVQGVVEAAQGSLGEETDLTIRVPEIDQALTDMSGKSETLTEDAVAPVESPQPSGDGMSESSEFDTSASEELAGEFGSIGSRKTEISNVALHTLQTESASLNRVEGLAQSGLNDFSDHGRKLSFPLGQNEDGEAEFTLEGQKAAMEDLFNRAVATFTTDFADSLNPLFEDAMSNSLGSMQDQLAEFGFSE